MRYRKTIGITIDPDVRKQAERKLPQGRIRSLSALIEKLLNDFLDASLKE